MRLDKLYRENGKITHPWRLRIAFVLVCLVFVAEVAVVGRTYTYGAFGTNDFVQYWGAGQLLLAGQNPYDAAALGVIEQAVGRPNDVLLMWNPPWTPVLMLPLLFLSFGPAALVWVVVNLGLLFLAVALLWHLYAPHRYPAQLGIAWLATLGFVPALITLRMGQGSLLILIGLVGFLALSRSRRDVLAGMCLSLVAIKPHVVYLALVGIAWWVMLRRRWGIPLGFVVALGLLAGVTTAFTPHALFDYLAAMQASPTYWLTPNLWRWAWLVYPALTDQVQFWGPAATIVVVLAVLRLKGPQFEPLRGIGPLLLVGVPTAAYGWTHDQSVLLIPYIQLIGWFVDHYRTQRRVVITGGLVLLGINALLFYVNGKISDHYQIWFPLTFAVIFALVWLRVAKTSPEALGMRSQADAHQSLPVRSAEVEVSP